MPFLFKLAQRWSRFRELVVTTILVVGACEFQRAVRPIAIDRVELTPSATTVQPHQTVDFRAVAIDSDGDTADVAMRWSATGGSITDMGASGKLHLGRYEHGSCGNFKVIARSAPGGKADTANVTVACPQPDPVASVNVTPPSASLEVGQNAQLTATPKNASGTPLSGRVITWASSNTGVATVSTSGRVTGGAAGGATITATSEGQSGTSAITVTAPVPVPVASVTVTPASASVNVGQTVELTATPRDANGTALSGRVITWASSNTGVATVSTSGEVTGGAAGGATITATSEGQSGTSAITVTAPVPVPVASVTVTPASASVNVGQTVELTATPRDANGSALSGRVIIWASSNTGVATVSTSGEVTGVAAGGATITATSEGRSGTSAITVTAPVPVPVASVTVTPASASLNVGQTVQLTATPRDANGSTLSGRAVTWASNNTAIATVNAAGLVRGVVQGSAVITATSEGQSGTAAITVTLAPVASVSVTPASASVDVGATVQLTAAPRDASGNALSGRVITWASSNTAAATVSGAGLVTGVAVGSAAITATSEGQSGSSAITVLAAPPPGSGVVLVGAGDIASSGSGDEATALLLDNIPGTVFTAGDNVYSDGTPTEFANYYEPTWGRHKARTRPSPGNHDYNTAGATGYYAYFGALAGPAGRGYYSYDLGDWHIISLNSNISMSAGSVQEQWLRADLAASTKQCVLAMWHHPRFSSGSHGSSTSPQPLWQALYDYNADVVISGHDHNYQRFAPQTPTGVADPVRGIREFIVGSGGVGHYTFSTPIANTEAYNIDTFGVLKLTLYANSYTWAFIPVAGKTYTDSGSGSCH